MRIEDAKGMLTIFDLWTLLGLPGKAAASCSSPFREDRSASFSIFNAGASWFDHATSEGGDQVDFVAHALKVSPSDAAKSLIALAGGQAVLRPAFGNGWKPEPKPAPEFLRMPESTESGNPGDWKALARLRNVSEAAVRLAMDRGWLRYATMRDGSGPTVRAWILVEEPNAQARRLDGEAWSCCGGAKSRTLRGAQKSWPIGLADVRSFDRVAIVEGEPDALAALHLALAEGREDVAVVALTGASVRIPEDALPAFAGKRVRIFPHADPAGREASQRWGAQLLSAGATVDAFDLAGLVRTDGKPVADLNDLTSQDVDCWERNFEARELFNF